MKQFVFVTLAVLFCSSGLSAQEWSQFGDIRLHTSIAHTDTAVTDPSSSWFGMTDWQTAAGSIEMDHRLDFETAMFRLHHQLKVNTKTEFNYDLFEAYISFFPIEWMAVDIGKKHVNWSMGSLFLPIDAINPRTIDITSARQDIGFPGIIITLTPDNNFTITSALNFENSLEHIQSAYWQDFRYGLLLSAFFGNLQIKTGLVYEPDTVFRPGLGASFDIEGFVFFTEAAVDFHNRTFYRDSGGIWNQAELWTPWFYADAGVRKLAAFDDFSISVAAEYFFTSAGYTRTEETFFFNELPASMAYMPQYLSQHYVYANIGLETANLFATNHSLLINLQDTSMLFWHSITLLMIENLDLNLEVMWTTGSAANEFGLLPERIKLSAGAVFHF